MRGILKLLNDQRGATAIEYALVASLISVAAAGAIASVGGKVDQKYTAIDAAVTESM